MDVLGWMSLPMALKIGDRQLCRSPTVAFALTGSGADSGQSSLSPIFRETGELRLVEGVWKN